MSSTPQILISHSFNEFSISSFHVAPISSLSFLSDSLLHLYSNIYQLKSLISSFHASLISYLSFSSDYVSTLSQSCFDHLYCNVYQLKHLMSSFHVSFITLCQLIKYPSHHNLASATFTAISNNSNVYGLIFSLDITCFSSFLTTRLYHLNILSAMSSNTKG